MRSTESLRPRAANHQPLTPLSFLRRACAAHPDKIAVIDQDRVLTYRELDLFTRRFAGALQRAGIGAGDVVSLLTPNCLEMLAAHFAVPMIGAVLNTINVRLDAETIGYILEHAESRLLIADGAYAESACQAMSRFSADCVTVWLRQEPAPKAARGDVSFAQFLEVGTSCAEDRVLDEWQPICINYTSGTTGRPKGVVYHHRGAFLNSLGNVLALSLSTETRYLWILPMFHCNGWMHVWAVTAAAGTHVCMAKVDPPQILRALTEQRITHTACAPVVLYMLVNDPEFARLPVSGSVKVATGGAAPTPQLIAALEQAGFELIHLYGLTESYGPATLCSTPPALAAAPAEVKAAHLARQGLPHPLASEARVATPQGIDVPWDGESVGEILLRGNTLMAGYYKNDSATEEAFAGGWLHTGDLAVRHADGQIEIRDRAKDIIISGGENVASLEIEAALLAHPAVLLAAVVPMADEKWGEVPCAFIELKAGVQAVSEEELRAHCRERLAHFKVPRRFVFADLPKTATGKIQKYRLRASLAAASG